MSIAQAGSSFKCLNMYIYAILYYTHLNNWITLFCYLHADVLNDCWAKQNLKYVSGPPVWSFFPAAYLQPQQREKSTQRTTDLKRSSQLYPPLLFIPSFRNIAEEQQNVTLSLQRRKKSPWSKPTTKGQLGNTWNLFADYESCFPTKFSGDSM